MTGGILVVIKLFQGWLNDFRDDWRNQVWTLVQWVALITILFSPVWTERFSHQDDFRGGVGRDLASSIEATVDPAISSTILRIPNSNEESTHRVFVSSSQVRFEWRQTLERDLASLDSKTEMIPVAMMKLSREGHEKPEDISLIASDGGEVVVSTYVELQEGVNTFRIRYQSAKSKKIQEIDREYLVVYKKNN